MPQVFAESFIGDVGEESFPNDVKNSSGLTDYKLLCYDGVCGHLFTRAGRESGDPRVDFLIANGCISLLDDIIQMPIPKPVFLSETIDLAEALAASTPFVRVDLYNNRRVLIWGNDYLSKAGLEKFTSAE